MSELLASVFYSHLPFSCLPPSLLCSLCSSSPDCIPPYSGMSRGRAVLILAFCVWETARGGLNATSGMWQAVKAGSPAISGGSLSCCWRFLSFFKCSTNSAGGSWSPASQEKVIVPRVSSIILNHVHFSTLTSQCWDTWGLWPRKAAVPVCWENAEATDETLLSFPTTSRLGSGSCWISLVLLNNHCRPLEFLISLL